MHRLLAVLFVFFLLFSASYGWEQINFTLTQPAGTPYFIGVPEINVDAEEFSTLLLKIKSNKSGTARLFWSCSLDQQINEPKSLWFYLDKSSDYKEYVFNVASQNPYWLGYINQIVFLPDTGGATIEIGSAQAIPGNVLTNIKSAWREFWGPKGRVEVGSTINLIPSSTIFGHSINVYIYWVVFISFLFIFSISIFNTKKTVKKQTHIDFKAALNKTIKSTLMLTLLFWFLLALNADYNYFNLFKNNYSKYFGRSIEEKRIVAYGKDYYDFLVFAERNLPAKSTDFGLLSTKPMSELYARMYLVPHVYQVNPEKQYSYLLVFYPDQKDLLTVKGYHPYKKLSPNAYILEKNK